MVASVSGGRNYALVLHDGRTNEFRAESLTHALCQAQDLLPEGKVGTLMEDDRLLGRISYSPEGFWTISGAADDERPAHSHPLRY